MKVAEAVAAELMAYLDNEINNRDLKVEVDGEEWVLDSGVFRTSGPNSGQLEILASLGNARHGVSLKFEVTDDKRLR